MDILQAWDENVKLSQDDQSCRRCRLSKGRNNIVWYRGTTTKNVNVLLIGEAPGKDEDFQGKPFVGRAGKILDQWIKDAGIERYAIINIVKCRPPENRAPTKIEINACLPYLEKQIKEMNPGLIIALGRIACTVLINKSEVTANIGKTFNTRYGKVFIMPHPAYVLRGADVYIPIKELKEMIHSERCYGHGR